MDFEFKVQQSSPLSGIGKVIGGKSHISRDILLFQISTHAGTHWPGLLRIDQKQCAGICFRIIGAHCGQILPLMRPFKISVFIRYKRIAPQSLQTVPYRAIVNFRDITEPDFIVRKRRTGSHPVDIVLTADNDFDPGFQIGGITAQSIFTENAEVFPLAFRPQSHIVAGADNLRSPRTAFPVFILFRIEIPAVPLRPEDHVRNTETLRPYFPSLVFRTLQMESILPVQSINRTGIAHDKFILRLLNLRLCAQDQAHSHTD